jgi:hypothetical protein
MTDLLVVHSARACAVLDELIDVASADGWMRAWDLLGDPAVIPDAVVRGAVTVAVARCMEGAPMAASIDGAPESPGWWRALLRFVADALGALARDRAELPAVRRRELEPTDWPSRLRLWLVAVALAERRRHGGDPR